VGEVITVVPAEAHIALTKVKIIAHKKTPARTTTPATIADLLTHKN
jgi:hypothetical protein